MKNDLKKIQSEIGADLAGGSMQNKKFFKSQTSEFLRDLVVEHFNGQRIWPLENGQ